MKNILTVAILCFTYLICTSFNVPAGDEYKLKTVVIDAGHGGHDQGCHGPGGTLEKTVALGISLKLGALIEKNYPGIKVIYTRKTDEFIELYERAEIANRNKADLFICIHCNANPSTSPYGTETYVMGLHKTDANLGVAKRENDVILLEDNYNQHYDGFNPNDPASHIIFSLFQHAYMDQSILFAGKVEHEFKTTTKRYDRGVKQAGFLVLWKTSMPSVLVETGFLTNAKEEKYLASKDGQQDIAQGIFNAFSSYKNELEGNGGKINESEIAGIESTMNKEEDDSIASNDTTAPADSVINQDVVYRIQFYAADKQIKTSDSKFASLKSENIISVKENGLYKYRIGPYTTFDIALQKQTKARKAGFKDAFVLAYKNGKKITLEEAKSLSNTK